MSNEMYEVIDSVSTDDGTIVEVLQFPQLGGSADLRVAHNLFYASQSGMRLKMIRITLSNSRTRIEPGALYFMKGNLEMKASSGGGLMKGLTRKMLSGETFFVNEIHGSGEIYLEPSFGHFFLYHVKTDDKAIIVDKGLLQTFSGTGSVRIAPTQGIYELLSTSEGISQMSLAPGTMNTKTETTAKKRK